MKKQILLLAAIALITVNAYAQTFTGKIIDELSEPLAYATVQILNPCDSTIVNGGITDDNGVFCIEVAKAQSYIYPISYTDRLSAHAHPEISALSNWNRTIIILEM